MDRLITFPFIGSVEHNLSDNKEEYRALIVRKHFKVIYFIEDENIYIAAVWDCRQGPLININKLNIT